MPLLALFLIGPELLRQRKQILGLLSRDLMHNDNRLTINSCFLATSMDGGEASTPGGFLEEPSRCNGKPSFISQKRVNAYSRG